MLTPKSKAATTKARGLRTVKSNSKTIPTMISFGVEGRSLNQLIILLGNPLRMPPLNPEETLENHRVSPSIASCRVSARDLDGVGGGDAEGGSSELEGSGFNLTPHDTQN